MPYEPEPRPLKPRPLGPRGAVVVGCPPIRVAVGEQVFPAELYDNPTARDLADQLPLTITVDDLHGLEKTGRLPRALNRRGASRV